MSLPARLVPAAGLAQILTDRIGRDGPIGVDAFMAAALADPVFGYYMTRDPLGQSGDFTTAPEISQIFGELIGAWCMTVWQSLGCPQPMMLVELGPGRGTLMADVLRVFKQAAKGLDAVAIHLVETSPVLRAAQAETLARHHPAIAASWHNAFEDLPRGPAIVVANEFFDALPIRQWIRRGGAWIERCVGVGADSGFTFVGGVEGVPVIKPTTAQEGDVFETNENALTIARNIGERLIEHAGAALIIDYGHSPSACGDTLQALGRHRYAAVLEQPGSVDLTAHVDFEAVGDALRQTGVHVTRPVTQGEFLLHLGGTVRAKILAAGKDAETAAKILSGFHRLVHPSGMGQLFKVIAAASRDIPALPGFAPFDQLGVGP